jgi:hypothetical protein
VTIDQYVNEGLPVTGSIVKDLLQQGVKAYYALYQLTGEKRYVERFLDLANGYQYLQDLLQPKD